MAAIDRSAYPRFASKMSTRELIQHFTPSGAELDWARSKARGLRLQQAILVNLKCFQQLHYFPADSDIPKEVIAHVPSVLRLQDAGKPVQELSAATRYRQHAMVRQYLSISPFYGKKGRLVAVRAAQDAALIVQQRVDLVNVIIDELVRQRYELPAYSTLENIADVVASSGESKLMSLVDSRLSDDERGALDALLDGQVGSQRSPFDRIKQSPRRLSRNNMEMLIDQVTWLESLGDVDRPLAGLATQKVRYLASHAMTLDASDLKDLKAAKRYAFMLAAIQRLRARARDDIAEMFVRRMAKIHKRAKEELKDIVLGQRARTEALIAKLDDVLTIVAEDLPDAELGRRIRERVAPGNDLERLREECAEIRAWSQGNYLALMWKHFRSHRVVMFRLVRSMTLQNTSQDLNLVAALDVVLSHENNRDQTILERVDLSFASERWRKFMRQRNTPRGMVDRRDLEVCVFNYVAALLRAGDLAIAGADSYADYREQLLPWTVCQSRLPDYCAKVGVPETGRGLVAALREELTEVAARVDRLLPDLKDEISISAKGEPVLKRVQTREIPSSAVGLQANLNRRLPTRNLLDILANMERWTRFTRGFGPASGKDPKLKGAATRYLQTLFAMGCNLGPTQASKHFASQVTPHMLSFVHRRHMSLERLERATRDLTELYLRLDLPKLWGDGKAVAADGTQYDFYDNNLLAGYHFRYRKIGAVAYRHVANNYIAVFRHFIPPGIWEAVYVIEGLMKAGLSVEADTVYSDTQGQSASVFAFTYLMGIQLMPRIRNWKDLTFFRPDRKSRYQNIDQLFGETIQWDIIEAGQQELMQVVLSIQAGHLASPTLLRKLSYGGARNHLFAAAHEVGRAVRTIFLLKWISKLQLRQEVTANTNKIESYNGFAKWFSFGGEVIPENDPVEQQKRLRYNDLVAACVILQNTVDMMKALEDLTAEGQGVEMADVRFLSPYATSHVKRFGDYRLDLGKPAESWLSEATFREALHQSLQRPAASAKP